jgi:CheY-like chemotaxis protein
MIVAKKRNDTELMALIPSIKQHMNEWQIVNVNILENSPLSRQEIVSHFLTKFEDTEGIAYPLSDKKIVMLARLGNLNDYDKVKAEIETNIPKNCCKIFLHKMNAAGINKIQIDFGRLEHKQTSRLSLYDQRLDRTRNVILVADDDPFVRLSMKTLLAPLGQTVEVEDTKDIVKAYQEHNPDILLLDISAAFMAIPHIISLDDKAFILTLAENSEELEARGTVKKGAAGFLTKPAQKQKVQQYLSECSTIK